MKSRKSIVLGSIFATFILVSLAFVMPVQANAADDVLERIDKLSRDLSEDDDFLNLLDSSEVENLLNKIKTINPQDISEKEKNDLIDMFNALFEKQEFKDLESRYRDDIKFLDSKFSNVEVEDVPSSQGDEYFYVKSLDNKLDITQDESLNLNTNGIIVKSEDSSTYITELGLWIPGSILEAIVLVIVDIVLVCVGAAVGSMFFSLALLGVGFFLIESDIDIVREVGFLIVDISELFWALGIGIYYVAGGFAAIGDILLCFQWLIEKLTKSKEVTVRTRMLEKIKSMFQNLFKFREIFRLQLRPLAS
jgi:hypothetical protein